MSTEKASKINLLLRSLPSGVVFLSSWLETQGYSLDLQKRYRKSHWFKSVGTGAMIRTDDKVNDFGAIYPLQTQLGLSIHPGGKSALVILGKTHYLEFSPEKRILFGKIGEELPSWFKKNDWGLKIEYYTTSFLPEDLGLVKIQTGSFELSVSSPARAIMECLYLVPEKQDLLECCELFEGLNNLRPELVQSLLEQCNSVKVKRLFLYLAEKFNHDWFGYLNMEKISLGVGKRSIINPGVYDSKFQITVTKEVADYGT